MSDTEKTPAAAETAPAETPAAAPAADAAPSTEAAAPAAAGKEKKPAAVKVAKPSDEEHKAKVDALKADIEAINGKLAKIKEKLDASEELRSKDKGETGAILTKLRTIKDVIRKHIEELTIKRKELGKFKDMFDAEIKIETEIRKRLGDYNSTDSINERVAKLEAKLSAVHHTIPEEKKVLQEITTLKGNRKAIKEYEIQKAKVAAIKEQRNAMAERVKVKSQEIDNYRVVEKKHKAELDAAREKNKRPEDLQPRKLIEERNELRKQREAKWELVRTAHREHKAALDEYYNAVRAARKARDEERKAAWEATKEAREAEERARIEEELKKDPWEGHKALCESLISFLSKYTPEGRAAAEKESADAKAAKAAKAKKPEEDPEFVKRNATLKGDLLKKDDGEEAWGGFDAISAKKAKKNKAAKKANAKKAKAAAAAPAAAAGSLPIDPQMFEEFKFVEVDAPLMEKDAATAIEALKKRVEYYNTEAPRPTVEEIMAARAKRRERKNADRDGGDGDDKGKEPAEPKKDAEPKKKAAPKKKQAPPAVTDDAQFPTLGGAGPAASPVVAGVWS